MKKVILFLIVLIQTQSVQSQKLYGFVDKYFVSENLSDNQIDTLLTFQYYVAGSNNMYSQTIDRFNGRYFYGGKLPDIDEAFQFHIFDLVDTTVTSYSFYPLPVNMEYDFIRNRIIFENDGTLYYINLENMQLITIGVVENGNSECSWQKRTYIPKTDQFFYVDYKYDPFGDLYYLLNDALLAETICEEVCEKVNGYFYAPLGIVTNYYTGDIISHHNGTYGIVSPCDGTMTKLNSIPGYVSQANSQMAVFNHLNNTYIIPYLAYDDEYSLKYAIIDVYNDTILQIIDQPWDWNQRSMDWQQIYEKPVAPLILREDTLFVPYGISYKWYLNNEFIGNTENNYWIPEENGKYQALVEFREYNTLSTEVEIINTFFTENKVKSSLIVKYGTEINIITLEFKNLDLNNNTLIQCFDLSGSLVFNKVIPSDQNQLSINTSSWKSGMYIAKLNIDNLRNYNVKFIVK